jgi:hypothetical protein
MMTTMMPWSRWLSLCATEAPAPCAITLGAGRTSMAEGASGASGAQQRNQRQKDKTGGPGGVSTRGAAARYALRDALLIDSCC